MLCHPTSERCYASDTSASTANVSEREPRAKSLLLDLDSPSHPYSDTLATVLKCLTLSLYTRYSRITFRFSTIGHVHRDDYEVDELKRVAVSTLPLLPTNPSQ